MVHQRKEESVNVSGCNVLILQCVNISGCSGLTFRDVTFRNRYISFVRHAALLFQQWRLQKLQEQKETEGNEVGTCDTESHVPITFEVLSG